VPIASKSGSFNFLKSSGHVNRPVEGLIKLSLNIVLGPLAFLEIEVDKFKDF